MLLQKILEGSTVHNRECGEADINVSARTNLVQW